MESHAFEPDESPDSETLLRARQMAVREHSLMALLELNRELSVRFETHQVVDLVILNLMGNFGTRQAALWLVDRAREGELELMRGYGLRPECAAALETALLSSMERWSDRSLRPVRIDESDPTLDRDAATAARENGLALIGPLSAHGEIIGFVALGPRADGGSSDLDLDVLHSSLGVAGVAIENSRLFHELEARNTSLVEAYRDLMELDKLKTEFVQNVNHELRTPLAVITGAVECLLAPPDPDPKRNQLLGAISDQSRKLDGMVHSLLDYINIPTDTEAQEQLETLDLTRFVERYVFERSARVAEARHRLAVGALASGTIVQTEPVCLTRALDLLLDNALKFTPEGCTITLQVTLDADPAGTACLAFADDGPGFPPDEIARVFRPFYQVDGSATRTAGGLGIGLAVVKRLVATMGGSIDVESQAGEGTVFWIRLQRG